MAPTDKFSMISHYQWNRNEANTWNWTVHIIYVRARYQSGNESREKNALAESMNIRFSAIKIMAIIVLTEDECWWMTEIDILQMKHYGDYKCIYFEDRYGQTFKEINANH